MISVVIPTHNRRDLIVRSIKSVQIQTYKEIEIIIVSDGSTDGTKTVVNEMAENDNRIHFIEYYPAKGGNTARNTGIKAAKGEYIAFLDDDDEWFADKLETQMKVMESSEKIGLVYTGVHIIYENEKIEYSSRVKYHGDMSKKILLSNFIGTTSTVMVRKELFEQTGLFDERINALQDYDLWIRFCQVCEIGFVPEEKINYYNYTGNKQISSVTQKYINAFKYIDQKYEELIKKLDEKQINTKKVNEYLLLAGKAMRNGEGNVSRFYIKKALDASFSTRACVYWLLSFTSFKTVLKLRSIL